MIETASRLVRQKAARLLREGKVAPAEDGWLVEGDHGTYRVVMGGDAKLPIACSCPSGMRETPCSHRLAAFMLDPNGSPQTASTADTISEPH